MNNSASSVLSLGELLQSQPTPKPCLIEPVVLATIIGPFRNFNLAPPK